MSDFIPNSTQMPNLYLDRLLALLSGDEWKVVSYMARRLFGFHKRQDRISLSQIARGIKNRKTGERLDAGTGLNPNTIMKILVELVTFGIVLETAPAVKAKNLATEWALQLDSERVDWAGLEARNQTKKTANRKRTKAARKTQVQPGAELPILSDRAGSKNDPILSDRGGDLSCPTGEAYPVPQDTPILSDRDTKEREIKGKGEEEREDDLLPFNPPKGLADKSKRYPALTEEPTLRARAIVAAQGLGMTHFTGTFKKRAEKLGRKLDDRDWQAILDWCAYLDTKIGVWDGKRTVQVQDVTSWLVAAIRDAEPVPPMPEVDPEPEALPENPWMALGNDGPMNPKDENHALVTEVEPIAPNDPLVVAWEKVKGELKLQMTEGTFQTWVADTRLVSLEVDEKTGGRAVISYPNKYGVEWLSTRLYATIRRTLGGIYKISFTVQFQEVGA